MGQTNSVAGDSPVHGDTNKGHPPLIIVLDDEPTVRDALCIHLEYANYTVLTAGSYQEFIRVMTDCDVVLCDIILPDNNGLQALKWSREHFPQIPVIMITGDPTYETAAQAVRLGAYDYLPKPINPDELLITLARAVEHRRLVRAKAQLEAENEAYRLQLEQRVNERTRALRESQEFLTSLTNTMADAVISLSISDFRIEYTNRAVYDIFGYKPEELLGQTFAILYPDPSTFELFAHKQAVAIEAGQAQMRMEQLLRHQNNTLIWTEMAVTFIHADNRPVQAISVIRDITQRTMLLGVVAHELRGPLALLTGFSEALMDDIESFNQTSMSRYLDTMHRTATRMLKMVDELLDVAEIDLGQIALNIETIELSQLFRTQASDYLYIARKKNIVLEQQITPKPLLCECDPLKISQVVSNFIDNAVKYSPANSTVTIFAEQRAGHVWVGVKDQGPGIKSDEIQHLFKSFGHTKISTKPTSGEKSSGLGLAFCKKIVEAHRGRIGVESVPGQGSTFWFSLPVKMSPTSLLSD